MGLVSSVKAQVLAAIYAGEVYQGPSTLYMSLHTADPGEAGDFEVTGGEYARQLVTFTLQVPAKMANDIDVEFEDMPECTVAYVGIWDSPTGGTLLDYEPPNVARSVREGDTYRVKSGNYIISWP